MINDPLLPPPPPPPARTADTAPSRGSGSTRGRAKHPAMSARILATGLAATGTLGLTAGYAIGARHQAQPAVLDNVSLTDQSQSITPLAPATPQQPTESQALPQQQSPGRVVQVPVPGISPASPGKSSGNVQRNQQGPAQQQSSGSN